jgi:pyruvate formate-lyase activating enzyme-like uncharacterized protein
MGENREYSSRLRWLTEERAVALEQERERLLSALLPKVRLSFKKNKLHMGKLSPGCDICGRGEWSCVFVNQACTRNCFYCGQDKSSRGYQGRILVDRVFFERPKDYNAYLKKFNFKGVGFSGGECLLAFDKVISFIEKIKEEFDRRIYVWIYTNGDLVTKDRLRRLKTAGLDEIRYNISAGEYSLKSISLAAKVIKTVTVEIPAIPEDYRKVNALLTRMVDMGVDYLNIHQLGTTSRNYRNYLRRGYTFLRQPNFPIVESEMAALKILLYAVNKRIRLPINYCASLYKFRFQGRGGRKKIAFLIKDKWDNLTPSGYLRRILIRGDKQQIKISAKNLAKSHYAKRLWTMLGKRTGGVRLKLFNFPSERLVIEYFEPRIVERICRKPGSKILALDTGKRICINKVLVFRVEGLSGTAFKAFIRMFLGKKTDKDGIGYFCRHYDLKSSEGMVGFKKEIEMLEQSKHFEQISAGLPSLY